MKKKLLRILLIITGIIALLFIISMIKMAVQIHSILDKAGVYDVSTENTQTDVAEAKGGTGQDSTEKISAEKRAKWEARLDELLAPPQDAQDNLYDSDYIYYDLIKLRIIMDSKAYDQVLPEKSATVEDIRRVCEANAELPQKYKDFIIQYAQDWLRLWPESDLRVLCHNLKTIKVIEATQDEIMMAGVGTDVAACYLRSENAIYVLKGTDFSKGTEGYIILTHELTHAARSATFENEEGEQIQIMFYKEFDFSSFAEEALIMRFCYEMQGSEPGNGFYVLLSNYYRIFLECIDYDGADFMNHSINYLADTMDEFMEGGKKARDIIGMQDAEASLRYTPYHEVQYDESEFDEMHAYVAQMYWKKYLDASMSREEAEKVFTDFMDKITKNFDRIKKPFGLDETDFRPSFEQYCKELGIH